MDEFLSKLKATSRMKLLGLGMLGFLLLSIPVGMTLNQRQIKLNNYAAVTDQLTPTPAPATPFGKSLLLNKGVIKIPDGYRLPDQLGNFTIEMWTKQELKPDTNLNGQKLYFEPYLFFKSRDQNDVSAEYGLHIITYAPSGSLMYDYHTIEDNDKSMSTGTAMSSNQLTHVAVVKDNGTLKLYVNGHLYQTVSVPMSPIVSTHYPLYIGGLPYNTFKDPSVYGIIDEVRISNSVRYSTDFVPSKSQFKVDAQTEALWNFDNDTPGVIVDSSGHGHNGTISGGYSYVTMDENGNTDPLTPTPPVVTVTPNANPTPTIAQLPTPTVTPIVLLTPTPVNNPPISQNGIDVQLSEKSLTLTCVLNDPNCRFDSFFSAYNTSGHKLYNVVMKTNSPYGYDTFKFYGFDTSWTNSSNSERVYENGDQIINTSVQFVPPQKVGTWYGYIELGGQTCNTLTTPPDCYYTNSASVTVRINVIDGSPTPTNIPTTAPTMTPMPTTVPSQMPTPTTHIPTSTPIPTVMPTRFPSYAPTPTIVPTIKTVTVRAYGTVCNGGYPIMVLKSGNVELKRWTVRGFVGLVSQFSYSSFTPVAGPISIHFINDCYKPPQDRNIYVYSVKINNTTYYPTSPGVINTSGKGNWMWANGYMEFPFK